jgi:alpha-N-arabinofuranosidase
MNIRTHAVYIVLMLLLGSALPGGAQTSLPIYTDSFTNGFADYSYANHSVTNTTPVHSGIYSISVNTIYWNAISFHHTNFDATPYKTFSFWVNGGSGGQSLWIYAYLNEVYQQPYQVPGTLPANTWQQVVVPLSALGAAGKTNLSRFDIKLAQIGNSTASEFYVDDVQLDAKAITVDATKTVRHADSRWFGANTAIWEYGFDSSDTLSLMTEMGCRTLRFPGGSFSDEYHWASNYIVGDTFEGWPTAFGNFMDIATNLGANVFITANYGTGTPGEAADWVRCANITNRCGFKYWEIGNECYGTWETDDNTNAPYLPNDPWTYAMRFRDYYLAMKAVDPTIKIGVVAVPGEDNYANNSTHPAYNSRTGLTHYGWTPVMLATLQSLGVTPDFMEEHYYPEYEMDSDSLLLQAATNWAPDATDLRQQIKDYFGSGGTNIELVCTENNANSGSEGKQSTSLVNGLYLADSMSQIMKTEFNSYLWWIFETGQDTNGDFEPSLYGWRTYGDFGLALDINTRYPTFYAMKLMQYFVQPNGSILKAASDFPLLAVYAANNTNGTVSLLVINKDPTNTCTSPIGLTGFPASNFATVHSYGMAQDNAARTNGSAQAQDIAVGNLAAVGQNYTYAFPPYSLTLITFTVAAPSLNISLAANQIIVSWPASETGWTLQTNNNLSSSNWGNYLGPVINNSVTNSLTAGSVFFRLSNP